MTTLSIDRTVPDMRRGACPALSAPMMTGDGLLARIALTDAITPGQLAELCRLARRHGNGMLDISARGNLQVRGLSETSAPRLDADVRAMNLPLREGLAIETPPLCGLDGSEIADPRPLAEAIRQGAGDIEGLAPKMSVVVDGHGRLRLSDLVADIRLVAVERGDGIWWKILLGETEKFGRAFNVLRETHVVGTVLDLLQMLSSLGSKARGRDLPEGLSRPSSSPSLSRGFVHNTKNETSQTFGTSPGRSEEGVSAHSPFSLFALSRNLHAAGIGPAFGQSTAEGLIALCDEACRLEISAVKPAFDHSLLFFGAEAACRELTEFATGNGFITSKTDPRGHIAACSGSPACRSASIATHQVANRAAAECGDLLDGSFKLHVTGCPKGCAHPQASALTLCGTADHVSLVASGKATSPAFASAAFADTNATLRRLDELVKSERRAGENSAACLARIGSERLAQAAMSGRP